MKKINLIEWLWKTDSHEKQKPQRFARYAAMLIMLLTLGVGQMWGIGFNKGNVVFRAQGWNNPTYVYLCIGKSDYTSVYQMTRIANTDLYHVWVNVDNNDDNWWNGCTYFAVIGSSSSVSSGSWGSSSLSSKGNKGYTAAYTSSYDVNNSSGIYFFNKNNSTVNGGSFSIDYKSSYTGIPTVNAIQSAKRRTSGTSYSTFTGDFPASIKLQGTHLTGDNTSARNTITRTKSSDGTDKSTYSTVITGDVTHTIDESTLSSDYYLEGWGTSSSPSVTDASYTYKITANTTVYAFFSQLYTLTFLPKGTYGTSTVTASVTDYTDVSSGDKVPTGHSITITATPATGYKLVNSQAWFSDASCETSLSNGTSTTYTISSLNATRGVYVKFEKKTYSITLDDNGDYQGNGSATVQRGDGALTVSSHASRTDWNLVGYWTSGGTQVTDAEGNLIAGVSGYTDGDGNWIYDGNVTLYAHWSQTYSLTVLAGSNISSVTGSNADVTLGTKYSISATANSGYSFSGWTASPAENATFDDATSASTKVTVSNGSVSVTAAATEIMRTITISGGHVYGGAATSTTAGVVTSAKITANDPADGKKFTGWSLGAGVSLKGGYALTDQTIEIYSTANATVTATYADRASVKMYFAKPTNLSWTKVYAYAWKSSDASVCNKAYPGVELENTEVINCVTYYTYQYYTEGDGIGGAATGNSAWNKIVFGDNNDARKTGDLNIADGHYYYRATVENTSGKSSAITSAWYIKGTMNSWDESAPITHDCANNKGTVNINLTKGTTYEFKVYNETNNQMWSNSSAHGTTPISGTMATATTLYSNDANVMKITANVTGPYTFEVSSTNAANPKVKVTFPTSYTVTYNAETFVNGGASHSTSTTGGTVSAVDGNSAALSSGGLVISGGTAVITASKKTGYSFIGFYTSAACTTPISGAGVSISDNVLTLSSISGNKTVYAKFSENMTTVNLVASPTGKGTFTSGGGAVTSVSAGVTTHPTVTAVPASGYRVNTSATVWSESSDYITISATNAASTTITATGESGKSADLTATFTPNQYTITLKHHNGEDDGSVSVTYDDDANLTSSVTPPTKTGYTFGGYYTSEGGSGTQLIKDDGDWKTGNSYINGSGNWVNAGDVTLHAKWTAKTTTISFSQSGTGYGSGGQSDTKTATYDAAMPTTISVPTAADGYAFMGYYDALAPLGTQYYDETGASARNWDKEDATATLYAYFKKAEITGITFTDGAVVAPKTSKTVTAVISPTPTGTTTVCWRVLYSNDNPMDPQPKFSSVSGNSVSFTAPAASGMYKMEAVLHLGSGCGGEELSTYVANFQVAGDHTVTVQYKDASGNVIAPSGSVTGKPLEWTEVVAHEIFGYTYSGMTAGDGVTLRDTTPARLAALQAEDPTIVGVKRMKAVYDGKLTINYTQNQMIYFKNTLGWENVYVNFHTGNAWNNESNGSGSPKGVGNSGLTNANKHMTRIGDTDVWYYDYGYNNGGSSISPSLYISFTDQSRPSASEFWDTNPGINVVYPANYADALSTDKSSENGFKAATPMFVPLSGVDPAAANVGGGGKANYYNRGYWTTYTAGTGYTLEIYYDNDASSCIQSIPFTSADDLMPMSAVVDLEASTTYRYQVRRGGTSSAGIYYGNTSTMTYANHGVGTGWIMENTMAGGFKKAKITTNASGNYTFNLSYSPNASNEYRLRMEVDYPIANNDYRLIYTDATRDSGTRYKPSAIVTKANNSKDTVSFFVRPGSTPVLKIQQATVTGAGAITWGDLSDISSSVSSLSKDSVYNICLTMNESGAISVENVEAYTGNFYIRTNAAGASKWDNYRSSDHLMTYSEYSATNADYSHYFMAYVGNGTNVKFVVANDYSPSISDTVTVQTYRGGDSDHVAANGDIKADANVRFMWNRHNNGAYRAYLAAAKSDGSKFLVLRANSNTDLMDENGNALLESATSGQAGYNHGAPNNSMQFIDDENWIYETTVKIKPGAFLKLYANFHNADFYYKGVNNSTFDKDNAIQLLGGSGDAEKIRVIYDFKTDRLVSAWMPTGDINEVKEIYADVMFVREHQGDIEQLTFSKGDGEAMGAITKIETAYGVLRFNKWTINNKSKADGHAVLDPGASRYERDLFYVSFPFRVAMNEVFGFGTYGKHWIIEYYDGAARAEKGFWADTPTYWRFVTDRKGKFFEPNQGYIIALDLDEMGESSEVWDNGVENVELYFPSYGEMGDITNSTVTYKLDAHTCTIGPRFEGGEDRRIADSHWNVMSVPTYVNTNNVSFSNTTWTATRPNFLYEWNMGDNSLTPRSGTGYTYHAMHAYMVQYEGDVTWTSTSVTPSSIVARRAYAEAPKEVEFRLELSQNEQMVDQTFVKLSNDEEVSASFVFGEDMSKEFNKNKANIYTMVNTMIDGDLSITKTAGNTLPMSNQTTVVPVGVEIAANGDYTFAIPEGTEGIGVTLIDTETGIRTSLSALDYTVSLSAGTYNERFVLEISPIKNAPTGVELLNGENGANGVRKVLIDGLLYIVKDGKMFDARGAIVK